MPAFRSSLIPLETAGLVLPVVATPTAAVMMGCAGRILIRPHAALASRVVVYEEPEAPPRSESAPPPDERYHILYQSRGAWVWL
jgi:hypothetical protein